MCEVDVCVFVVCVKWMCVCEVGVCVCVKWMCFMKKCQLNVHTQYSRSTIQAFSITSKEHCSM